MKSAWTKFTTETGLICGYRFDEGGEYLIKVFTKLAKGYYYSAFNEAGNYFDEHIKPTLNETNNETNNDIRISRAISV